MKFFTKASLALVAVAAFTACKKEQENIIPENPKTNQSAIKKPGKVEFQFHSVVNGEDMMLDSAWYITDSKDTFTVSEFKYYLTGFMLHTKGGSTYSELNSYHLLDERDPSSLNFSIKDVPPGIYDSISFTIGVDSAKTVTTDFTGVLSPSNDMYWHQDFGFIVAKLEGKSPQSPDASGYKFHVGGYKGMYVAIRKVGMKLLNDIEINNNVQNLHINADAARFFYGKHNIRLGVHFGLDKPNAVSVMLADNYKSMFSQRSH